MRKRHSSISALFDGGYFEDFGRFFTIWAKKWIFQKGHLREIHQISDLDTRVSLATYLGWAVVQGRLESACFPS
jgi:hypothetical protein